MVRLEEQSAELKANLTSASSLTNHESKALRSYIPEVRSSLHKEKNLGWSKKKKILFLDSHKNMSTKNQLY